MRVHRALTVVGQHAAPLRCRGEKWSLSSWSPSRISYLVRVWRLRRTSLGFLDILLHLMFCVDYFSVIAVMIFEILGDYDMDMLPSHLALHEQKILVLTEHWGGPVCGEQVCLSQVPFSEVLNVPKLLMVMTCDSWIALLISAHGRSTAGSSTCFWASWGGCKLSWVPRTSVLCSLLRSLMDVLRKDCWGFSWSDAQLSVLSWACSRWLGFGESDLLFIGAFCCLKE